LTQVPGAAGREGTSGRSFPIEHRRDFFPQLELFRPTPLDVVLLWEIDVQNIAHYLFIIIVCY
jgi:hypothetical protein